MLSAGDFARPFMFREIGLHRVCDLYLFSSASARIHTSLALLLVHHRPLSMYDDIHELFSRRDSRRGVWSTLV